MKQQEGTPRRKSPMPASEENFFLICLLSLYIMVPSKNDVEPDLINEYLELTSGPVHFMMAEGEL